MFIENVLKVKNEGWRYVVGFFIIFFITQLGSIPFTIAIFSKIGLDGGSNVDVKSMMTVLENSNLTLFYALLPYVFGFFGIILVVKKLHNQSLLLLTTTRKKIDYNKIVISFIIAGFIIFFTVTISYLISPNEYLFNFKLDTFLILLCG